VTVFTDQVVTLSPLTVGDVAAHIAGEDAELVRWLSGGPAELARTTAYFRMCEAQWDADGGSPLAFGIRTGDPLALAGTIDLRPDQPSLAPGQVNIAYGLYPQWRGRGLATRAVLLACEFAATLGLAEAVLRMEPENTASVAVAERAGFTHIRTSDEHEGVLMHLYTRKLDS
jgi:RimJ/RimL family protein N-acetyltransferase